ncbi:O-antigen ligase family protein [Providencia rettgeri]
MKNFKLNLTDLIIYFFALTAPLSTTFLDSFNLVITALLFILFLFLFLLKKKSFTLNIITRLFLISYTSFILISTFSIFYSLTDISSQTYSYSLFSRLGTSSLILTIIVCITAWANNQPKEKLFLFLKVCFFSTIIFGLFSIYQLAAFEYNLPFIDTRANVYGASYEVQQNIGFRLTSITREPNFYSPILIESILISFIILKRKTFFIFLLFSIFLIYKTYSTGAYIHLLIIMLFVFLFYNKSSRILLLPLVCIIIPILLYTIFSSDNYFINKLTNELNGESTRSYIYFIILNEFFHSNIFHLLFGYGMNTLQSFNELTHSGYNINFSVSNSFYIDILWDSGLIGITIFLLCYIFLFRLLKKHANCKIGIITLALFFSLIITSLYRSEYTTTHFAWITSIIIICHILTMRKEKK